MEQNKPKVVYLEPDDFIFQTKSVNGTNYAEWREEQIKNLFQYHPYIKRINSPEGD